MRGDTFDRKDGFLQTSGSNQWPPGDDEDSPCDRFECKVCGYEFSFEMYGSGWIGDPSPDEKVTGIIRAHMLSHAAGL